MNRRLAEALHPGQGDDREQAGADEVEIDAIMTFSSRELLQRDGFREDVDAPSWRRPRTRSAAWCCRWPQRRRGASRPIRAASAPTCAPPCARSCARATCSTLKRKRRADAAAAAGDPVRHLRLDEPLQPAVSAFHARRHQRPRPRLHLPVRHAAHQHHAPSAPPRRRRGARPASSAPVEDWSGGTRIGQCLAEFNRRWSRRVLGQGAIVLLITDGLDRDAGVGLGPGDGPAAQILPPPHLAQPAVALRGFRAQIIGDAGYPAACRRVPAGPQSRQPGRSG